MAPASCLHRLQKRLLAASGTITEKQLAPHELLRNKLGDILVFRQCLDSQEREFCTSTLPKVRERGGEGRAAAATLATRCAPCVGPSVRCVPPCSAAAQVFKDVLRPGSQLLKRPIPPCLPPGERGFVPALVPGTTTGVNVPLGFSTMKTMKVGGAQGGGGRQWWPGTWPLRPAPLPCQGRARTWPLPLCPGRCVRRCKAPCATSA